MYIIITCTYLVISIYLYINNIFKGGNICIINCFTIQQKLFDIYEYDIINNQFKNIELQSNFLKFNIDGLESGKIFNENFLLFGRLENSDCFKIIIYNLKLKKFIEEKKISKFSKSNYSLITSKNGIFLFSDIKEELYKLHFIFNFGFIDFKKMPYYDVIFKTSNKRLIINENTKYRKKKKF